MYEFDIKTLWETLMKKRNMIIRNCLIGGVLAVVIGYSIPKEYNSDVVLAAELQESGGLGGSAASLASLAGISLGSSGDALGPNLYPNVVSSNKFIVDLLACEVENKEGNFKGTFRKYLEEETRMPWWSAGIAWVKGLLKGDDGAQGKKQIDPYYLNADEDALVTAVRAMVVCSVDDEYGTIKIRARSQDPVVSRMLVDAATELLQDFITLYRTNKARVDLKYYQGLEEDALKAYRQAQHDYAVFNDSHRDISLQSYINERESLQNDLQLAFNAYSQMKQQVIMAVAKVQENTPAFTVIEAASVPLLPDSPRKKIILIGMLFVTFMASVGWVYFSLLFNKLTPILKGESTKKASSEAISKKNETSENQ